MKTTTKKFILEIKFITGSKWHECSRHYNLEEAISRARNLVVGDRKLRVRRVTKLTKWKSNGKGTARSQTKET